MADPKCDAIKKGLMEAGDYYGFTSEELAVPAIIATSCDVRRDALPAVGEQARKGHLTTR